MPKKHKFIVKNIEQGLRIDLFLTQKTELGLSRAQVQRIIDQDLVKLNQKIVSAHSKIKENDEVEIEIPALKAVTIAKENIPLDVVFEDQDLIVVNKPRGMVVHPAVGNYSKTLVNALLYHCQDLSGIGGELRPGIVHRLDKDTSGLIVIAKNDLTHQALAKQFQSRKILKKYLALVHGNLKNDEGIIDLEIGRHPKDRKKMFAFDQTTNSKQQTANKNQLSNIKTRSAVTLYKVLNRFEGYSLVELTLKTGRTHQIRVHLNALGHPVVGDPMYGGLKNAFKLKGQLLHSAMLGFIHPRTKEYLEFEALMPTDMLEIISKLQK